jgi:hypothetical protein
MIIFVFSVPKRPFIKPQSVELQMPRLSLEVVGKTLDTDMGIAAHAIA